ncbi:MAG: hypothetical protein WCH77_04790 [Planctomycetota bacterium]
MTIRSRRSALRFESLEQRALLAVVVSPADQMESVEPVEQLEPVEPVEPVEQVEQVECVELTEQFEQCKLPIIIICPGPETGDDFTPPDAEWPEAAPQDFLAEYDAFLAEHPDWLSDHGADGIQLMVIAPSTHLPWIELSTPGAARAFDAWYEQTYLQICIDYPPFFAVDEEWPLVVEEEPVVDFVAEEWLPVERGEEEYDGTSGFEEETLFYATLPDVAPDTRAAAFALPSVPATDYTALSRGFAFAQLSESLAERPASGRPKLRGVPPRA